jgi:TRAP-type mannitol/chloroaromatic compound transport system permease large subunit
MKGVAPPDTRMTDIYAAAFPYVLFGLLVLMLVFFFPWIATGPVRWLT